MDKKLQISKLDAAKRQIETAIRLYFSNGDPVSIHTLIAAAYNVIRDINKKRGGDKLLMKDGFMARIKEGHEKEVRKLINKAENFFKHADRDHDDTIEFNPGQSEFLFLESCSVYAKLTGEFPPLFKLYRSWFIANHQNLFNFSVEEQRTIAMGAQDVLQMGKEQYFNMALPLMSRINT
jgi:hypothetical protein